MAQARSIDYGCFEFLYMEIINYVNRSEQPAEIYRKLELMGYRVGYKLVERKVEQKKDRFRDDLDVIRFLCREFWKTIYDKHINKLTTNHKGIYMLTDDDFQWIKHFPKNTDKATVKAYLYFPCGIIRGALANLGIEAIISASEPQGTNCKFTVNISK